MNLKTKTSQNRQKIEQYGSPTTKELKKKHLSILIGGAEMGSQGEKDACQSRGLGGRGGGWQTGWSHVHVWISWEEQLGSETDRATQGSSVGN